MATTMGDVSNVLFNICRITFFLHLLILASNVLLARCQNNVVPNQNLNGIPVLDNKLRVPIDNDRYQQQRGKLQLPANNGLVGGGYAGDQRPMLGNAVNPNLGLPGAADSRPLGDIKAGNNAIQDSKKHSSNKADRIAESDECRDDYNRFCSKVSKMNNFAVLECLQNSNKDSSTVLIRECNQYLWNYKMELTDDKRFREAAAQVCRKELDLCPGLEKFGAELLSCLVENVKDVEDTHCRQFVNRMEIITFSDYRLLQPFYSKCSDSVASLGCGSVQQTPQDVHLQGQTIQCLESKLDKVDKDCKAALLRIAELSSDDYHKDRALYFACRDDRERFCDTVAAGEGRVYKCLLQHKKEKEMSDQCFEALTIRQRVVAVDVKANKQLIKNCRREIQERGCVAMEGAKEVSLSSVLLCLEKNATNLSGECQADLFDIRKSLMEDYKVNPEIITFCIEEIRSSCNGLRREGKTLHCLMERAMKEKLSPSCNQAVLNLLKEVKAGNDFRLDPILAKTCSNSKGALCSKIPAGDAKVLSCLMDNVDSELMDKQCAQKLYELQYFISRDYTLDHQLFVSCKRDAKMLCNNEQKNIDGSMFACLHNHLHEKTGGLSSECSTQVHRALRQRAALISLNPMIEKKCRADLGHYCMDQKKKLDCLQNNYEGLEPKCKQAVHNYTQEESEDIRMNKALMKACSPMLKRYCQESLKRKVDEGDALVCLISHKNDADMDPKCAAGIEHFQIVQLKDYTLTFKFKQACKSDIQALCEPSLKSKENVLTCLSTEIRKATLLGEKHRVSENCRAQVKFEMLQKSEDIKLDPELNKACTDDLRKFCSSRTPGNADSLECLRKQEDKLSDRCYEKLFNRARELQEKPEWDYFLVKACQQMIKTTCKSSKDPLMECLQNHMHDANMDTTCKQAVTQRLQEESRDYRLNPTLRRVCFVDIGKFCGEKRREGKADREMDLQGAMMKCLQGKLEEGKKTLSPLCEKYVRHYQVETALNFELDPDVKKACTETAKSMCAEAISQPGEGLVIECLKDLLRQKKLDNVKCKNQIVRLTAEGVADVHVDPLLQEACRLDLKHYCHGVMRGQGQQMACLLEALEDKSVRLQKECEKMLKDRKELWEYAAEVAPPETLNELYLQLSASPSRNHFLMSFLSFMAGILFFGVCCGRATKRLPAGLKNK